MGIGTLYIVSAPSGAGKSSLICNAGNQSNLRNEGICFTHYSRYAPWWRKWCSLTLCRETSLWRSHQEEWVPRVRWKYSATTTVLHVFGLKKPKPRYRCIPRYRLARCPSDPWTNASSEECVFHSSTIKWWARASFECSRSRRTKLLWTHERSKIWDFSTMQNTIMWSWMMTLMQPLMDFRAIIQRSA